MSNSLDPEYAQHFVRPDLGISCLQGLSVDNSSRRSVKLLAHLSTLCSNFPLSPYLVYASSKDTVEAAPLCMLIKAFAACEKYKISSMFFLPNSQIIEI